MRSLRRLVVPAALSLGFLFAGVADTRAQVTLSFLAGGFGFSGEEWDDLDPGFGGEGVLGYRFSDRFTLGGVFHWSTHDFTGEDATALPGPDSDRANQIGLLLQPLVHFGPPGETDFFVGARGGYVSVGDVEGVTGVSIGGVAGAAFPVASGVSLGLLGTWSVLAMSDDYGGSAWGGGAFLTFDMGGSP